MKTALLLLVSLLVPLPVSAAFVNFADEGSPVTLTGFFHLNGSPVNTITGENPQELSTTDFVSFQGTLAGDVSTTVWFNVYDDDSANELSLVTQLAFMISNNDPSEDLVIGANALELGVTGLFALGAEPLDSEFTFFYMSIDGISFTSHYDEGTGRFWFTNDAEITIEPGDILMANGNFSLAAVPEPSACGLIAGIAVAGLIAGRRRAIRR